MTSIGYRSEIEMSSQGGSSKRNEQQVRSELNADVDKRSKYNRSALDVKCDIEVTSKCDQSGTGVRAKWIWEVLWVKSNEIEVRPKRKRLTSKPNRSTIKVKWKGRSRRHQNEVDDGSKWNRCEFEVTSNWDRCEPCHIVVNYHRSKFEENTKWNGTGNSSETWNRNEL